MRKINVCFLKRKRRWVFPLVCLRWQCHLGLFCLEFCGWSCKPLLAGVQCTFPVLPTQASSTIPITAGWTPKPFLRALKQIPMRKQITPVTPKGKTEGLPWKRGLIPWMTVSSLLPVLRPHPTALYRPSRKPALKYFVPGCGWGRLKERDEICPSMSELGHGWGDIRVTVRGEQQNKNFGHGNLHYQCEQPAFLLHLRML